MLSFNSEYNHHVTGLVQAHLNIHDATVYNTMTVRASLVYLDPKGSPSRVTMVSQR